jgi:hypothetical protein
MRKEHIYNEMDIYEGDEKFEKILNGLDSDARLLKKVIDQT